MCRLWIFYQGRGSSFCGSRGQQEGRLPQSLLQVFQVSVSKVPERRRGEQTYYLSLTVIHPCCDKQLYSNKLLELVPFPHNVNYVETSWIPDNSLPGFSHSCFTPEMCLFSHYFPVKPEIHFLIPLPYLAKHPKNRKLHTYLAMSCFDERKFFFFF